MDDQGPPWYSTAVGDDPRGDADLLWLAADWLEAEWRHLANLGYADEFGGLEQRRRLPVQRLRELFAETRAEEDEDMSHHLVYIIPLTLMSGMPEWSVIRQATHAETDAAQGVLSERYPEIEEQFQQALGSALAAIVQARIGEGG